MAEAVAVGVVCVSTTGTLNKSVQVHQPTCVLSVFLTQASSSHGKPAAGLQKHGIFSNILSSGQ